MEVITLQQKLRKLGINPRKQRGQHFLIPGRIADEIVNRSNINKGDTVLEIGPGLGVLTFNLAERAKEVIAIELEPAFARNLRTEAEARNIPNLTVLEGDALTLDLPAFDKVVSNLPYNISSPLLFRLLSCDFTDGVLMFQREYGHRLLAGPGTKRRGTLTLKSEFLAEFTELINVPAHAFFPVPQVDSIVVGLRKRPFPHRVDNTELYLRLIEVVFQHRRRKLRNSLLLGFMTLPEMKGIGKDEFRTILAQSVPAEILEKRPEDLETSEMVLLANALHAAFTQ